MNGANGPDTEPPLVDILSPADGLELDVGASVELEVAVTDNHDGAGWKFMVYKDDVLAQEQPTYNFQTKWALSGLPAGIYRLRIEAIDHDRNVGFDEVTLYVGQEAPAPGSSTGDDPTTTDDSTGDTGSVPTGSAGDTGQGEVGGSAGSSSTTLPGAEGEDGCSCDSTPRTPPALAWTVLAAGLLRRRKSR